MRPALDLREPGQKGKAQPGGRPEVSYFLPADMETLEDACFVSHSWERGRDYEHRDKRLRAFILFARWTVPQHRRLCAISAQPPTAEPAGDLECPAATPEEWESRLRRDPAGGRARASGDPADQRRLSLLERERKARNNLVSAQVL